MQEKIDAGTTSCVTTGITQAPPTGAIVQPATDAGTRQRLSVTPERNWRVTGDAPEKHRSSTRPAGRNFLGARRRTGPRGRLGRGTACAGQNAHSATGAPAADATPYFLGLSLFLLLYWDGVSFFFLVVWLIISCAAGQANSRTKPLYGAPGKSRFLRCESLHDPTNDPTKCKPRPATDPTPLETPATASKTPLKKATRRPHPRKKRHPPRRPSKRPEWLSAPSPVAHPHMREERTPVNGATPLFLRLVTRR